MFFLFKFFFIIWDCYLHSKSPLCINSKRKTILSNWVLAIKAIFGILKWRMRMEKQISWLRNLIVIRILIVFFLYMVSWFILILILILMSLRYFHRNASRGPKQILGHFTNPCGIIFGCCIHDRHIKIGHTIVSVLIFLVNIYKHVWQWTQQGKKIAIKRIAASMGYVMSMWIDLSFPSPDLFTWFICLFLFQFNRHKRIWHQEHPCLPCCFEIKEVAFGN